jgi:hypothetical protein
MLRLLTIDDITILALVSGSLGGLCKGAAVNEFKTLPDIASNIPQLLITKTIQSI